MMITCQGCLSVNLSITLGSGLMSSVGFRLPLLINRVASFGAFMDESQTPVVSVCSLVLSLIVKESQKPGDAVQFPFVQT